MNEPTFVAIGHMVYDVVNLAPSGLILGGAASYSTITARNLGLKAKAITSVGADFKFDDPNLDGIEIDYRLSEKTTTFQNIYDDFGKRQQFIRGVADKIRAEHMPQKWHESSIVYLCPVADEVDLSIINLFKKAIIGVSPQGWMRKWDASGRVSSKKWSPEGENKNKVDAVILSEEDLAAFPDPDQVSQLLDYQKLAKYVILTQGKNGATLLIGKDSFHYPAFQTDEIDPTGAGDVFAASFLIRYFQTLDPHQSTVFANCAASFAVEKQGLKGIPKVQNVLERLKNREGVAHVET